MKFAFDSTRDLNLILEGVLFASVGSAPIFSITMKLL
jgi:hypothetical protein